MPQPYSGSWRWVPDALSERPNVAVHVGTITGLWSGIEMHMGLILATMMHTEAKVGMKLYMAVTNDGARKAMFDAIVQDYLDPALQPRFAELLKINKKRADDRNLVAHAAWGLGSKPDTILRINTTDFANRLVEFVVSPTDTEKFTRLYKLRDIARIEEYEEGDFLAIRERMKNHLRGLSDFYVEARERVHVQSMVQRLAKETPRSGG